MFNLFKPKVVYVNQDLANAIAQIEEKLGLTEEVASYQLSSNDPSYGATIKIATGLSIALDILKSNQSK